MFHILKFKLTLECFAGSQPVTSSSIPYRTELPLVFDTGLRQDIYVCSLYSEG